MTRREYIALCPSCGFDNKVRHGYLVHCAQCVEIFHLPEQLMMDMYRDWKADQETRKYEARHRKVTG